MARRDGPAAAAVLAGAWICSATHIAVITQRHHRMVESPCGERVPVPAAYGVAVWAATVLAALAVALVVVGLKRRGPTWLSLLVLVLASATLLFEVAVILAPPFAASSSYDLCDSE